jgi:O-acetyl-ADP-ribose deacetylase (regulator of RNase III)
MPAISLGIFGFPKDRCAKILVEESKTFLEGNDNDNYNDNDDNDNSNNNTQSKLHVIEFCIFDNETAVHFENELARIKCICIYKEYCLSEKHIMNDVSSY